MILKIFIKYNNIYIIINLLNYIKEKYNIDAPYQKKKFTINIDYIIFIFTYTKKNELSFTYKSKNASTNGNWNINEIIYLPNRLFYKK